ncbi:MAG TPA: SAM hydroxide adenosyltransferase, partial [Planctomycetota bacterium]|nr:SAM hydroxide adenosyltransferase [Planctomycetota bacterium]
RPRPRLDRDGSLLGEVVSIDRFGNLITTIAREDLRAFAGSRVANLEVQVGSRRIPKISNHYAEAARGEVIALVDSLGFLEVAVRDGSATRELAAKRGAEVRLRRRPE